MTTDETAARLAEMREAWEKEYRQARAMKQALDSVLDYWQPCDIDTARGRCLTHRNYDCQGAAVYAEARQLLGEFSYA